MLTYGLCPKSLDFWSSDLLIIICKLGMLGFFFKFLNLSIKLTCHVMCSLYGVFLCCCVLCILLIMTIHMLHCINHGCGFGCGHNVCAFASTYCFLRACQVLRILVKNVGNTADRQTYTDRQTDYCNPLAHARWG